MKLESIYDRGIKFHHYCNTAYRIHWLSMKSMIILQSEK